MSTDLTKLDIDNLIESVGLWEHQGEIFLQSIYSMRAAYTNQEQLAEFDTITAAKIQELKKDTKIKKDQAIILKYKLVKIKDSIEASKILNKFGIIGEKDEK